MIIQLQPDQVAGFWSVIRHSLISINKVPENLQQDYAIKSLERLLSGKLQCWVGFTIDKENKRYINVVYTTSITNSETHGFKALLIESAYGLRSVPLDMYKDGADKLEEFAKESDCSVIATQTNVQRVRDMAISQGYSEQYTTYRKFI